MPHWTKYAGTKRESKQQQERSKDVATREKQAQQDTATATVKN